MRTRTALIIAASAAVLAMALVAADLRFQVDVDLQENVDGEWVTVTGGLEERIPGFPGCAGPELRLVVDNDRLIALDTPVTIKYWKWDGNKTDVVTVLEETWHIPARSVQDHPFVIPESAFDGSSENHVNVDVRVGDRSLGTCVEGSA